MEREDIVVKVGDDEIHSLTFDQDTINKFWDKARQFPTVYGQEVGDFASFMNMFFDHDVVSGLLSPRGLFWVLNDFTGVFYLTEIIEGPDGLLDANAHYTFFDKRHRGRVPLVKEMLKFWFTKYEFQRLSAAIPNYVTAQARHFAQECGMCYEGKKRKCAKYKGEYFDMNLYGILKSEVLHG